MHRKIKLIFQNNFSWTSILGKFFLMPADGLQPGLGWSTNSVMLLPLESLSEGVTSSCPNSFFSFTISPVFRIQMIHFWNVIIPFKFTL